MFTKLTMRAGVPALLLGLAMLFGSSAMAARDGGSDTAAGDAPLRGF